MAFFLDNSVPSHMMPFRIQIFFGRFFGVGNRTGGGRVGWGVGGVEGVGRPSGGGPEARLELWRQPAPG